MTEKETVKLFEAVVAEYGENRFPPTEAKLSLWSKFFSSIPYEVVWASLILHIAEGTFPPQISDIMKHVRELAGTGQKTPEEVWEETIKAVRKWGWYQKEEALAELPKAVWSLASNWWEELCHTDVERLGTIRAQFLKSYVALNATEQRNALLPPAVQAVVGSIAARYSGTNAPALPAGKDVDDEA